MSETEKPTIVDELRSIVLRELYAVEQDVTAAELSDVVCTLLDLVIPVDDAECDKLCDWVDEIKALRCKMIGTHTWEHDHCGYWGHQYCSGCRERKYPEIPSRCSVAIETLGRITEAEYLASKQVVE
jgi:hypothetical protein